MKSWMCEAETDFESVFQVTSSCTHHHHANHDNADGDDDGDEDGDEDGDDDGDDDGDGDGDDDDDDTLTLCDEDLSDCDILIENLESDTELTA